MRDGPGCTDNLVYLGSGKIMGNLEPYDVEFTATLNVKTQQPELSRTFGRNGKGITRRLMQERGSVGGVDATTTRTMETMRFTLGQMNFIRATLVTSVGHFGATP